MNLKKLKVRLGLITLNCVLIYVKHWDQPSLNMCNYNICLFEMGLGPPVLEAWWDK